MKSKHNVIQRVTLKNRLNNETVSGDLIKEEDIDGKRYFVLFNERERRTFKLAKDAFILMKR
jgi:hypothetical protein